MKLSRISRYIHDEKKKFSRSALAQSENLASVNGGDAAPVYGGNPALRAIEERRYGFDRKAKLRTDHGRVPAATAAEARDCRSRHGAPRRILHHGRVPAATAAEARDCRSRHGAPRRILHHGRVPAAPLETSTVTAMNGVP